VGAAPRKIVMQATPASTSVAISKFAFAPATLTIGRGQSVTWTNADAVDHTVTSAGGATTWDSGPLGAGASFTQLFDQAGSYSYACTIHPFMRATVTVQ
jgi:plastocyanin